MALDFPASPTNGQVFTSGGMTYVFNGTGWTVKGGTTLDWVLRAGDTMTGALVLPADPASALQAATKQYVDAQNTAMAYNGMQVNGSMEVSQENGSTPVNLVSGSFKYVIDGWGAGFGHASAAFNAGQYDTGTTPLDNTAYFKKMLSLNSSGMAAVGAADFAYLHSVIEGYRSVRLGWGTSVPKPITIAFWVYASASGTAALSIHNKDHTRSYMAEFTTVAGTWVYRVITIPAPADGAWEYTNYVGLSLFFVFASGSNYHAAANTWHSGNKLATPATSNLFSAASSAAAITGVVVLPGTQAPTAAQSPLIMRPFDQELLLCQRYYYKTDASNYVTCHSRFAGDTLRFGHIFFPVRMRATPTTSISATINGTGSYNLAVSAGVDSMEGGIDVGNTTNILVTQIGIADARL